MVRAAAKNHAHVGVLVDPADYPVVLEELRAAGSLSPDTRRRLARAAFAHTAAYDAAIVAWFDAGGAGGEPELLPPTLHLALERAEELRYGENPHQRGARYRDTEPRRRGGTASSSTAARRCRTSTCSTPTRRGDSWPSCGTGADVGRRHHQARQPVRRRAVAPTLADAYRLALECDPVSAFGGVVALGGTCTARGGPGRGRGPAGRRGGGVVVRPRRPGGADCPAQGHAASRRHRRTPPPRSSCAAWGRASSSRTPTAWPRRVRTGRCPPRWPPPTTSGATSSWRGGCVPGRRPTPSSSPPTGRPSGVGAGQQSRVEAAQLAVGKAGDRARGAAAASDAFFPFRDGLDVLAGGRGDRRRPARADRCETARSWLPPTSTASPWCSPASATSGTEHDAGDGADPRRGGPGGAGAGPRSPTAWRALAAEGIQPGLGTILVGDDPASERYVALKHDDCAEVGIVSVHEHLPEETSQEELEAVIRRFNADPAVHAYLVQLPLPERPRRGGRAAGHGRRQGRRRPAPA